MDRAFGAILRRGAASLVVVLGFAGVAASGANAAVLTDASSLQPGLAAIYYFYPMRSLSGVEDFIADSKGRAGPPVPSLDYKAVGGRVMTSRLVDSVMADITGYLNFPAAGVYRLQVESNDGVIIQLDGKEILKADGVHADLLSDPFELTVDEAGWHELHIYYFEHKGTSTLRLLRQAPGESALVTVPPADFAHTP
jgi:hypothetical protein